MAGGTLLVAALFSPVRRRVQASVDRRFFRSRYDGAAELSALNRRLRGRVDLDGLETEIAGTVSRILSAGQRHRVAAGRARADPP